MNQAGASGAAPATLLQVVDLSSAAVAPANVADYTYELQAGMLRGVRRVRLASCFVKADAAVWNALYPTTVGSSPALARVELTFNERHYARLFALGSTIRDRSVMVPVYLDANSSVAFTAGPLDLGVDIRNEPLRNVRVVLRRADGSPVGGTLTNAQAWVHLVLHIESDPSAPGMHEPSGIY